METVVPPPADAELNFLTDWSDQAGRARRGRSAVLSLLAHVAAIVFLMVMPETFLQSPPLERKPVVTPLIDPPITLTQREPNPSKTIREMRSSNLSPRLPLPPGPSPDPTPPTPHKAAAAPPPAPAPPKAPPAPLPEPPKVEIASNEPPKMTLPVQPPAVPQPKAKPSFQDVPPATTEHGVAPADRVIDITGPSVESAIRANLRTPGAKTPGIPQPPSSGADLPQLLSDPGGVDWSNYLSHVRAQVKQYWDSIIPALSSVRAGRSGLVSVQFAIARDGTVRKAVFAQSTGDKSLDDAAVQAISGGSPFGPLPVMYKGGEIHVQMNFMYNVPK